MSATAQTVQLRVRNAEGASSVAMSRRLTDFLLLGFILGQLVLVAVVLNQVDILAPAYRRVAFMAFAGCIVNHLLPLRFRLPFFATLSLVSVALVLGMPTTPDVWWDVHGALRAPVLIAIGALFIAVCHLPIGFWLRAVILAGMCLMAAIGRRGMIDLGSYAVIWPMLAGFFMFRIMVYLYDVSTGRLKITGWHSAAYFFMLPNACATFFPVVDFKTMVGSHYNQPAFAIYQRGVHWITRGVIQMLLYRFIDQLFSMPIKNVDSGVEIVRYCLANSLVYLNVSGGFHFIVGLLLLFGFNLPETNHHYFLASSFSDYWRRVNIYWKDFMMKTFYYPAYFRLKKLGPTLALALSVAWVFFLTWGLHLYQTWWLKADITISWPDILFWSILGVLVLINSLWEMRRSGRKARTGNNTSRLVVLALQTMATFAAISLLWSLWASPSVSTWLRMWRYADRWTVLCGGLALLVVGIVKIAVELSQRPAAPAERNSQVAPQSLVRRGALQVCLPALLILVVAQPEVQALVPDQYLEQTSGPLSVRRWFDTLQSGDSFTPRRDRAEMNYYQRFTRMDEGNRLLFEVLFGQRIPSYFDGFYPINSTSDIRQWELQPNFSGHAFETEFKTNSAGMRDKEYPLDKPSNTVRIAVLGSSHVMGWGVSEPDVFETVLENRLNRDHLPVLGAEHVEVLNFAVYGYGPLSQIPVMQKRVSPYHPNITLLVGHPPDLRFINSALRSVLQQGKTLPSEELRGTLKAAHVYPELQDGLAEQRLKRFEPEVLLWSFKQIAAQSRSIGSLPVYAFFPTPNELPLSQSASADAAMMKDLAAQAGFVVFDLSDVFAGQPPATLMTGGSGHSSAQAHALIAEALNRKLASLSKAEWGSF
jgi:hypothetical protein